MDLYPYFRRLLFCLSPERAHYAALRLAKLAPTLLLRQLQLPPPDLPVTLLGMRFPNPVGLAAGFDRHGDYIDTLARFGFGFLEIGTVTPRPQPGNRKPRIIRLPDQHALINRIGFHSKGLPYLLQRLQQKRYQGILGINIGKNADTPLAQAHHDYQTCLQGVYPYASYVTVNISSPNTPGLRELQHGDSLNHLLSLLIETQQQLRQLHQRNVPLLIKLAPDLDQEQIAFIAERLICHEIDGVVATNTTLQRPRLQSQAIAEQAGGLSGAPLIDLSVRFVKQLHYYLGDKVPIIGLGGIVNGDAATALINAGARLVQLYTGLIYQGPQLITDVIHALQPLLQQDNTRAVFANQSNHVDEISVSEEW